MERSERGRSAEGQPPGSMKPEAVIDAHADLQPAQRATRRIAGEPAAEEACAQAEAAEAEREPRPREHGRGAGKRGERRLRRELHGGGAARGALDLVRRGLRRRGRWRRRRRPRGHPRAHHLGDGDGHQARGHVGRQAAHGDLASLDVVVADPHLDHDLGDGGLIDPHVGHVIAERPDRAGREHGHVLGLDLDQAAHPGLGERAQREGRERQADLDGARVGGRARQRRAVVAGGWERLRPGGSGRRRRVRRASRRRCLRRDRIERGGDEDEREPATAEARTTPREARWESVPRPRPAARSRPCTRHPDIFPNTPSPSGPP